MEFLNGYIKNPPEFRVGQINISPFSTEDIFRNKSLWLSAEDDGVSFVELKRRKVTITESATKALDLILAHLNLTTRDEVWIVTTSGNKYISGCVTRTIEKYCRWKRNKTNNTAAILVNHEFGFVYRELENLFEYGLPVIEDCAYSMYSQAEGFVTGFTGDYTIFSLSKMFPMQAGGLLFSSHDPIFQHSLPNDAVRYFKSCFKYYNGQEKQIIDSRRSNYFKMAGAFSGAGFYPWFNPGAHEMPGAFVFKAPGSDLTGLKQFLQRQGVECSVFYGEEAFYLPCHQNMNDAHIDYLFKLTDSYLT